MKPVYVAQPFPYTFEKSLYLASPAWCGSEAPSWRTRALERLAASGYDGVVYIPESPDGRWRRESNQQMEWELNAMRRSDVILFWMPAAKHSMPGDVAPVEIGFELFHGKVILGLSKDAKEAHYLEKLAKECHIVSHPTLEDTVDTALRKLGTGAKRSGAECLVPLELWCAPHFQQWYTAQLSAGHLLEDVKNIEWVFRVGPDRAFPLLIAMHVAIKVCGENRIKSNEVVIIRPSIVTVCAYCPGDSKEQDRFILVKEYRTSVMNEAGFVFELPGGSSFQPGVDQIDIAIDELEQETGVRLARERFRILEKRQIAATMVANEALLLTVQLDPSEMDEIAAQQGEMHGKSAETEQTYLHVCTRQQIMQGKLVDYATLGQISLVG
jgi:nucleoside 2-deoxyribosyltransferase/8-oxo-dGTP pyrophosphatase MutT (NUDIX family)